VKTSEEGKTPLTKEMVTLLRDKTITKFGGR
jgi:hypothetical protein